ncbi:MAG: thioredoxin-disulfide reductase [Pelagibacteraceae bacterium]|nr:thioredoxin-disulfide reductase [Pelagibacteraceae bacterium]OUV89356.1 MAG: thioredoxin-disulfide reductase [Pelagibacteraceae bacterium TMED146]RZO89861.1 MAG: thioredoxin-disulfide reductase [alpha proteobacterium HIMB114]|tara:strand:+ start:10330 stop:11274 length:945 start_codon:yes stop_codon:yes gene_type:complete
MSQNKEFKTKVLIIGSGPAGYSAAVYTSRAMLKPIMVTGMEPGGQLTTTTDVENYPGFAKAIQGPWLMEEMKKQAENVGTEFVTDIISDVDFSKRPFVCKGQNGNTFVSDTVIISTGAQARWLGIENEESFKGFGVSSCATCDGFFYKGKEVAVVGGGNAAVEEAIYLSGIASKVYLIHRRDELRAEKMLQEKIFKNKKIEIIWNTVVEKVNGTDNPKNLESITIKNVKDNLTKELKIHGFFVAIGHNPATNIFKNQIKMDDEGYIITNPDSTATNIEGVFAAGDVKDKIFRQAITAAGMGCMAALEAEKLLNH